ncbi:HTH-type transcriptional activator RhaS [termite gut metagenome]|uniref:HTH-type transcriptional activator RhaS n=1 Tax=termite gut metagenome TaxID=433724 RepID=A0A5J4T091_9ZZZZ
MHTFYFLPPKSDLLCLLLLLGGGIYYSLKLKIKNQAIVKQIKELQEQIKLQEQKIPNKSLPEGNVEFVPENEDNPCPDTRKDKLCIKLRDMLHKDRLYRDPNLTRDGIITRLGTNKSLFIEAFKYCFETSFPVYINSLRLKDAIPLLDDSDLTLEEIAERVGFGTLRTFQRQFRMEYSMSITNYRKLTKSQDIVL